MRPSLFLSFFFFNIYLWAWNSMWQKIHPLRERLGCKEKENQKMRQERTEFHSQDFGKYPVWSRYSVNVQFSSVQSLSHVRLFATPWIGARQASLSFTISWSSLRLMSIESVMPSSHLILCRPLLLPSIPPSIRVFSNESTLHMRWPKYWSFSFSIIPSKEIPGLIFRMD